MMNREKSKTKNKPPSSFFRIAKMALFIFPVLHTGCSFVLLNDSSDFRSRIIPSGKIELIVDISIYDAIKPSLLEYATDLSDEGIEVEQTVWSQNDADSLRSHLASKNDLHDIDGFFFVGNLPIAWYEISSASKHEVFPTELYFMDPDAGWTDTDGNGIADTHTRLVPEFYVSRIIGTEAEIKSYFDKIHAYRTGNLSLPVRGYVFKDDDWSDYFKGSSFGLSEIYADVEIRESLPDTKKINYANELGQSGSEFVNQWIHSTPSTLYIRQENTDIAVTTNDISSINPRGLFYNLYDCSAARFSQVNLGMTYLTKTDYALAIFGSTKVGGCYYPQDFYEVLGDGGNWGQAYMNWYVSYGYSNDSWFLGMVILGDPALKPTTGTNSYRAVDWSLAPVPAAETISSLENVSWEYTGRNSLLDYNTNP